MSRKVLAAKRKSLESRQGKQAKRHRRWQMKKKTNSLKMASLALAHLEALRRNMWWFFSPYFGFRTEDAKVARKWAHASIPAEDLHDRDWKVSHTFTSLVPGSPTSGNEATKFTIIVNCWTRLSSRKLKYDTWKRLLVKLLRRAADKAGIYIYIYMYWIVKIVKISHQP